VRVTTHVALAPEASCDGLQITEESAGGVVFVEMETIVVLVTPFHVPVTFTEVVSETVPALELKFADVDPAGTITLAGTGNRADDDTRVTIELVSGALVKVTVQLVLEPGAIDAGVQLIEERAGVLPPVIFRAPPEFVSLTASPAADVPITLFMATPIMDPFVRFEDSVTATLATTPLPIGVKFKP